MVSITTAKTILDAPEVFCLRRREVLIVSVVYQVSPDGNSGTESLQPNFGPAGPPLDPNGYAACGLNISPSIDNNCVGLSASVSPSTIDYYSNETFSAEIKINATADSTAGTYMLTLPGLCGEGMVIYFILGSKLPSSVPLFPSLCVTMGHIFNATANVVSYQGAYALQLPAS